MYVGPQSSLSRLDNYKAKVRAYSGTGSVPDYVAPVVQFKLGEMYRKAQRAFADQADYQTRLTVLLGAISTSRISYAGYHAFAGQMYRLTQKMTGDALAVEVATLLAVWVARGLSQVTLMAIRTDIFSVPAPAGA